MAEGQNEFHVGHVDILVKASQTSSGEAWMMAEDVKYATDASTGIL